MGARPRQGRSKAEREFRRGAPARQERRREQQRRQGQMLDPAEGRPPNVVRLDVYTCKRAGRDI